MQVVKEEQIIKVNIIGCFWKYRYFNLDETFKDYK